MNFGLIDERSTMLPGDSQGVGIRAQIAACQRLNAPGCQAMLDSVLGPLHLFGARPALARCHRIFRKLACTATDLAEIETRQKRAR